MPTITTLPPAPSTSDPANFSSKADAHILALQTFTAEVNAFGAELSGAGIITPTRNSVAATATTTQLWTNSVIQDWTGAPTITALPNAIASGSQRIVYPAAGTIITNGGNISVQGNASYTVASGDELVFTAITTSTFYVTIKRKDGAAIVGGSSKLQSVTCTQASGALTFTLAPAAFDFRSSTLTSGSTSTLTMTVVASLVLPSGGTLGFVTTISGRIIQVLMSNGELAIISLSGGVSINEEGIINTTAISAGSTANNVFYSTTARTGLSYRVVGAVDVVNTAGAWGNPSLVQPMGGNALTAMSSLGYGQTWQDVTGSRALGTTYYNTTGKPIQISVSSGIGSSIYATLTINGVIVSRSTSGDTGVIYAPHNSLIPIGASYSYSGGVNLLWSELR